ncbi:MAG: hypothetical protein K2X81_15995 [Candidatus Obscuribacterales bacterium]|jgi:hypothetical protein|nr:hypothetical protein [Candidatus Obscuribacterales bacterium]
MNVLRVGFLLLLIGFLLSAESLEAFCADQNKWFGYILDNQCADSIKGSSTAESFAQAHTKDCAIMCKDKGYCLYLKGKCNSFDARGNELASKLLQESKRVRGFYVQVTGKTKDGTLGVESLEEIPEPNKHNGVNNHGSR